MGSGIRRVGSRTTALGSGITDHAIGISSFLWGLGSGCTTFVGSGTKTGHGFGIKEQKFAYKNGISDEKHTSLPPCYYLLLARDPAR